MATKTNGASFQDFDPHTKVVPIRMSSRRAPAGARVTKTGRTEMNTAFSEWAALTVKKRFGDIGRCGILWASNLEYRTVAGKFVDPQTKGATPIRLNTKSGNLTVYMNNVFHDRPEIRPEQLSSVSVTVHDDPESPWFTVHLNLALAAVRSKSRSTDPASVLRAALDQAAPATD